MELRIRYLSDLHLEFIDHTDIDRFTEKIKPGAEDEICILAGDVCTAFHKDTFHGNYDALMQDISKKFSKTFVISGNHEYYSKVKSMADTDARLEAYFQEFDNISFLHNSYEYYKNYCFIGTTLWSNITDPLYKINDVSQIPNFDYIAYNKLNKVCVEFLEQTLQDNNNCVVITHHMPSSSLIHEKYKTRSMEPYQQWFYCDMDSLIMKRKDNIKCWIYGHTHTPSKTTIYDIPFVCNPIGYPYENKTIDYRASIILPV